MEQFTSEETERLSSATMETLNSQIDAIMRSTGPSEKEIQEELCTLLEQVLTENGPFQSHVRTVSERWLPEVVKLATTLLQKENTVSLKACDALDIVGEELDHATELYGPMTSPHEGYAVILEELDELWEEVRKKPAARSKEKMRAEAKQIAAMAIRFMVDCT